MKIRCINPNHKDSTPSLHVYSDSMYCFVCGYYSNSLEVAIKSGEVTIEEIKKLKEKEPENVEEKIKEIQKLRTSKVRGLHLPSDQTGYYIVWPDKTYYKLRRYDDRPRYVGPRGVRAPIFWLRSVSLRSKVCVITEGELNALSLKQAFPDHRFDIVSPGSANELSRHTSFYTRYDKLYIFVDRDPAGVYNGIRLKEALTEKGKRVILVALEKDFNDILQESGTQGIKETLRKELGIS